MSCESLTVQTLRDSGYRLTPQRMLVSSIVRHADRHLTATQILDEVQRAQQYIDASTVYRTLAVLRELGLVAESGVTGSETVYEWIDERPHHHLICRRCGSVASLDHEYVESLSTEIRDAYGFRADLHHFVVPGLCDRCDRGTSE